MLDVRGKISAAVIGFYAPVAIVTFLLFIRYSFRRDAGWAFLFLFSLMRIASGALIVGAEVSKSAAPSEISELLKAGYILYDAGLPILFMASIGFLGLAGQYSFSEKRYMASMLRGKGLLGIASLAFSIAGDVEAASTGNHIRTGMILRRIAAVLLAVLWVFLTISHIHALSWRYRIARYRHQLLRVMILALPFLGVRTAYFILNAWSSADLWGTIPSQNPTIAKFNVVSGNWVAFLVMMLVMEYVVALIYILSGTMINLHRDT